MIVKSIAKNPKKPDKREYTLMIVPHHGKKVFQFVIPFQLIKIAATILSVCGFLLVGGYFHTYTKYSQVVSVASKEKEELEQLRAINDKQAAQIQQLAQATAGLQEDMIKLNQLDAELRRIVNSEDQPTASRAGVVRTGGQQYGGQGGPVLKPQIQELTGLVNELQATAQERTESLTSLKEAILAKKARLAARPSIWPASGEVTSRFGWRGSPWGGGGGDWHPGIDIAGDYGTPIYATADGYVVHSEWNSGGYGNMVEIDHGNGMVTIYGHNSRNVAIAGSLVKKGDVIAYMGSTGYSTGVHVHYEVRVNGSAVNPESFLR